MPILTTVLISAVVAFSACLTHCGASKMRDRDARIHEVETRNMAPVPAPAPMSASASASKPVRSSAQVPATKPASVPTAETAAAVQADAPDAASAAAAIVYENETAVFLNAAAPSAIVPQAEPVVASASTECRTPYLASHPLADKYAGMVWDWPGLSDHKRLSAAMILVRLDAANGSAPFSALRDPIDIVGVVCRSVLLLGPHSAHKQVLGDWYKQYQDLCLHGEADAANFSEENLNVQHKLSDWCSDSDADPAASAA